MRFISHLSPEVTEHLQEIFNNCPVEFEKEIVIKPVNSSQMIVHAGEKVESVFVLLKGKARRVDMQLVGRTYTISEFDAGEFFGEVECLTEIQEYLFSVQAVTPCTLCVIPARRYYEWMRKDNHALFLRTQKLLFASAMQAKDDRKFFLQPCRERMIQYFVQQYEISGVSQLVIEKGREELSSEMGFCVRTIYRNLKKLEKTGMITLPHSRICVSEVQYERMKAHLEENLTY